MKTPKPTHARDARQIIAEAIFRKNAADGQRLFALHASRGEVVRAVLSDLQAAGWQLLPPADAPANAPADAAPAPAPRRRRG